MKHYITILTITLFILTINLGAEPRTWTSIVGTKIEAELVEKIGNNVTLKTTDGRVISVAINQLSAKDQTFVSNQDDKKDAEPEVKEFYRIRFEPPFNTGSAKIALAAADYFKIKISPKKEKDFMANIRDETNKLRGRDELAEMLGMKTQKLYKAEVTGDLHKFIQENLNDKLLFLVLVNNKKVENAFLTGYSNSRKIYELTYPDREGKEKAKLSFEDFEAQFKEVTLFYVEK